MSDNDASDDQKIAPMGRAAANGAVWLGAVQVVRLGMTVISTIMIARLLSPDAYGVIAMVSPVFALIGMLQDLGLGTATVQAKTLSWNQSNGLFWLNFLVSVALAVCALAIAPAVAWFYHDLRPGFVTAASAVALLLGGITMQHGALLNRNMRFRAIGQIDIASALLTTLATVVFAVMLRSYWALFFGTLAGTLLQSALTWRVSDFRPGRLSLRGVGDLARFGGNLTGFNLLNFFVRNADDVIVARVAGAGQAGLYDRSYKLMMMPIQNVNAPIARLLQPILSRLYSEPERFRRNFVLAIRGIALVISPPAAVATALALPLMPFLLGKRWAAAGPIFLWLGLSSLIQPIVYMAGLLYTTTGKSREMVYSGVFSAVVMLTAFAIGAQWGAVGIAKALFWSMLARLPVLYWWGARKTPVRQGDLWGAQFEPLIGAGLVGLVAWTLQHQVPFVPLLIASTALAYLAALFTSSLSRQGRENLVKMWYFAREHAPRQVNWSVQKS